MKAVSSERATAASVVVIGGCCSAAVVGAPAHHPLKRVSSRRGAWLVLHRSLRIALRKGLALVTPTARRYSVSMKVAIELPPLQAAQLQSEATRLGIPIEELVRAAVTDLLAAPDPAFQAAAQRILERNAELYRRLA
jgi:hypothetical protein